MELPQMVGCRCRLEDLVVCAVLLVSDCIPSWYELRTDSHSGLTTQAYALAFFLPIILNSNMGFDVGESQLLTAPPYAASALVMFSCAWIGDKYRVRGPLLFFTATLGIIGAAVLVISTRDILNSKLTMHLLRAGLILLAHDTSERSSSAWRQMVEYQQSWHTSKCLPSRF